VGVCMGLDREALSDLRLEESSERPLALSERIDVAGHEAGVFPLRLSRKRPLPRSRVRPAIASRALLLLLAGDSVLVAVEVRLPGHCDPLLVVSVAFSLPTPCEYFLLKFVQFLYRAGTTAPVRTYAEPAVTAFDPGAAANTAAASTSVHAAARAVFLICIFAALPREASGRRLAVR